MMYLASLLEGAGHVSYFLKCNASVPNCYNRLIKGNSKIHECPKCILGGVSSFRKENIQNIDSKLVSGLSYEELDRIVESTAFSLHRIETDEDCESEEVIATRNSLRLSASIVYANTEKWIKDNNLELVFIFNGRLDLPRAVLKACEDNKVPFITFEAAYPGIALEINDDCRSLKSLHALVDRYIDSPLTERQAQYAGRIAAEMLQKRNLVWRLYNTRPRETAWPISHNGPRVLIVPSSNHEFKGVASWTPSWKHPIDGIESILDELQVPYENCVVRCHPNWAENIGVAKDGSKSETVYAQWAARKGMFLISSSDTENTNDLIAEADLVIVQYGTAGIEAGLNGKKVIGCSPSWYSGAGFSVQVHGVDDLTKLRDNLQALNPVETRRKALRFLYVFHKRFAQYATYVQPLSVFENIYYEGGSSDQLFQAVENNVLSADDSSVGDDCMFENKIIEQLSARNYSQLLKLSEAPLSLAKTEVKRRLGYRWLDTFRGKFKGGDR